MSCFGIFAPLGATALPMTDGVGEDRKVTEPSLPRRLRHILRHSAALLLGVLGTQTKRSSKEK